MRKILIVDDDPILAGSLRKALVRLEYAAETCEKAGCALERIQGGEADLVLLDNQLPDMTGLDLLSKLKSRNLKLPVILMTAYGTEDTAIEAMKAGAYDYITKPFDLKELEAIIRNGFETYRLMTQETPPPCVNEVEASPRRMIGSSRKMQEICKVIGQIAETDLSVLVRGESGTGKELIAQAVYQHSRRKDRYFLAVNCAAIPETLLESELFGYEKGAFTGAIKRRIGKFEQCDKGTIFLDEIGDMPLPTQAKILRVLQYGEIERVGGTEKVKVNVRTIAATNKPLEEYIQKGLFREDLYYRLEAVTIHVPPLRERMEDLGQITEYLFRLYGKELKSRVKMIHPSVFAKLQDYHWPGNVRELSNTIQRALALAKGEVLTPEHIVFGSAQPSAETKANESEWRSAVETKLTPIVRKAVSGSQEGLYDQIMNPIEKILLSGVLKETNWNQVQAAKVLGLSRTTLREKMRRYGLQG